MRLIVKWFICFAALLIARALFPADFLVYGGLLTLAAAAAVLMLANLAIRPILQVVALPVTIVTFGLFSLVVNAGVVALTDFFVPLIRIRGFGVCLLIALLISLGNGLFAKRRRA